MMFTEEVIRTILSVVVVAVLIIILIRFTVGSSKQKDSLTILREKYENGDITKEDYERALRKRGKE